MELQEILECYLAVDAELASLESAAALRGFSRKVAAAQKLRQSTDRAYFVMLFASFESKLNSVCVALINHRKGKARWHDRRSWDVLPHDPDGISRLSFRNRLAYCIEKGAAEFAKIISYQDIRNQLAHTASTSTTFAIPIVATDLMEIARKLKRR